MNSQLIDVGIGLVLAFLVVSLAASSFVEMLSIVLRRRARDLERTVGLWTIQWSAMAFWFAAKLANQDG